MLKKKKRFCIYLKFISRLYTRLSVCGKLMEFCWSWWGCWCCFEQRVPLICQQEGPAAVQQADPLAARQDSLMPVRLWLVPLTPHSGPVCGRGEGTAAILSV